ncbi:MAG TPA: bifunctional diguanylate cyclase/phosphodiesterase [Steroidobacteraceae bacterium]|nr:bifunctional diguanylate cyclase/phosphodiesterase [Steroidobacteraceae bacterium]
MSGELGRLIEREGVHTLFQPIVDGATREAYGFEALSRGPAGSPLHLPAGLFTAAAAEGRTFELDRCCLACALRSFSALEVEGKIFLNVLPQTLLKWTDFPTWLEEHLARLRLDPHTVVLELTEHGTERREAELAAAVAPLRALGCDIAIDDLGSGASGLKTWSEIRPEYVKVDRYFVAGIEQDPVRAEILRSLVEMGRATGCQIVAEGIENREQCAVVRELGVDYLQGYLLGAPQTMPRVQVSEIETLPGTASGTPADCAEHLARAVPAVSCTTPVAEVMERFRKEPGWSALAVVEGQRPVGLIRRDDLLILYSKPLHPEVYARKPATAVMDRRVIQIDARARLEQISRLVTHHSESPQREDFIITRNGAYLGLGRTLDLLRQITTQQLQAAKQSNPLTGLPGNREIQAHLGQLIARRRPFIACHLDLDHFKAFNDTYGYSRGDQVLLHVAQVMTRHVRPRVDFVGHLGGDDFVFFLRSQDWSLRLAEMLRALSASLVNFHSSEHREARAYSSIGRDGTPCTFPLLSVSIAAVEVPAQSGATADSVADRLRRTKAAAKARPGDSCLLSSGDRVVDLMTRRDHELPELLPSDTLVMRVPAIP